jgi:hypothetical protein
MSNDLNENMVVCSDVVKEETMKHLPMATVRSRVLDENYAYPLEIIISVDALKEGKEIVISRHFNLSGKFVTLAKHKAKEACLQLKAYIASKEYVVIS